MANGFTNRFKGKLAAAELWSKAGNLVDKARAGFSARPSWRSGRR